MVFDFSDLFELKAYLAVPTCMVTLLLLCIASQMDTIFKRKRMDDKIFVAMLGTLFVCNLSDIVATIAFIQEASHSRELTIVTTTVSMVLIMISEATRLPLISALLIIML